MRGGVCWLLSSLIDISGMGKVTKTPPCTANHIRVLTKTEHENIQNCFRLIRFSYWLARCAQQTGSWMYLLPFW